MFEVCICPEKEVLNIRCKTFDEAKKRTKEYYPAACFMEIDTNHMQTAIYERFEMEHEKMNHIGNIWKDKGKKAYYLLPLDQYNQPTGTITEIFLTKDEYEKRIKEGDYICKNYMSALIRSQN